MAYTFMFDMIAKAIQCIHWKDGRKAKVTTKKSILS